MKKIVYILTMAVAMSFASCQKDDEQTPNMGGSTEVVFTSDISTRATGTLWDENDKIGVFMYESDAVTVYDDECSNVEYSINEGWGTGYANFTSANPLLFPNFSKVDFMAYYPYIESVEDGVVSLNTADQSSSEKIEALDFMVASATGCDEYSETALQFDRKMSKIIIMVSRMESNQDAEISDLSINDIAIEGTYTIANNPNNSVEVIQTSSISIFENESNLIEAIIIPQTSSSATLTFKLDGNHCIAPISGTFAENMQHIYTLIVGANHVDFTEVSITPWSITDSGDLSMSTTKDIDYNIDSKTYEIYSKEGLIAFSDLVNGSTCRVETLIYTNISYFNFGTTQNSINGELMNDIDLEGSADNTWTPIGYGESSTTSYTGTFDGGGYTISGLYVSGGTYSGQGLFSSVYNGTIKNLTVSGTVNNSSYNNTAGIAGYARSATFENCHNNASVSGAKYTAGIAGYCYKSSATNFTNCSNSGTITSSTTFAGGIVGKMFGLSGAVSTMTNCSNSGYVSAVNTYAGGLAAASQGGAIYNSYNLGEIYSSSNYVGGLVGIFEDNSNFGAVIENCYTSAKTTGSSYVGLAIGSCDASTITNCYYDNLKSETLSAIGFDNNSQSITAYTSLSELLTSLNSGISGITNAASWKADDNSYPAFSF